MPSKTISEGKLGEIGITSNHFTVRIGQKLDPGLSLMSKPGGTVKVNKTICRYTDGTKLYIIELMSVGPSKVGKCQGEYRVVFFGQNGETEELTLPVTIDVTQN